MRSSSNCKVDHNSAGKQPPAIPPTLAILCCEDDGNLARVLTGLVLVDEFEGMAAVEVVTRAYDHSAALDASPAELAWSNG
jgi:hypothetical protein